MSRLIARVYHYQDTGGEVLEQIEMRHPVGDPGPAAVLKLFEKSKLFDVHPLAMWGRGKTTDGYNYIASVYTARNDSLYRFGSSSFRIGCRKKAWEEEA
jgi:hypothetical protein